MTCSATALTNICPHKVQSCAVREGDWVTHNFVIFGNYVLGKVIAEVEIHSPADKFYDIWKGKAHHLPNVTERIPNVHMHEGSWGTHGSMKNWTYVADGKVEKFREKTGLDDETKTMTLEAVEGDPLKLYKYYNGIMTVTPKGQGSVVKWTLEYEKLSDDVADPLHYMELALKVTRDLDASLGKA